jgi:N-acetylglucosamine kinase-like BadF-type ATPase
MTILAGVDAGASHTEAVLGTAALEVLARVRGAPGAVRPDAVASAAEAIAATVGGVMAAANVEAIEVLVVGAAGTRLDQDRKALRTALADSCDAGQIVVTSDASIALESAFPAGPGVLLIAGTGSIAHARDDRGAIWRVGGLGWRFGDEGSGYALGCAALSAAVSGHEGRGAITALTQAVWKATNARSMDRLSAWMRDADVPSVARLAQTACDVADMGDAVAVSLVDDAGSALAEHVAALVGRFPEGDDIPLALGGGLLRSDTPVRQRLLTELATRAPRARVVDVDVDPPIGALRLAAKTFSDL